MQEIARSRLLKSATTLDFDVLVIGGGITGAGVALDAASRGLSVLLLEKDDFASGTSSRTTKLIHGGLRYLEQYQFKLVAELSSERAVLEQLAPHMVQDLSFVLTFPINSMLFSLKALLGLTVYDLMSWSVQHRFHRRLSRRQVITLCPRLSPYRISGGARFYDCQTDDARLVLEVIKTAAGMGAVTLNYVEVEDFEVEDGKIQGAHCLDRYHGEKLFVRCKSCVNATGVWVDQACRKLAPDWVDSVIPSRGTHIVVPQSAFETNTGLLLPADGGRYVFVIPWQRAIIIGTTDSLYQGDLDHPLPSGDEIDYLLKQVNKYAGTAKLGRADIIACWAGLRPLLNEGRTGDDTGKFSREHMVFDGPDQMVGIIGGKLTNFRLMAQNVVDKLMPRFDGQKFKKSGTRRIMLGGWASAADYLSSSAAIGARARRLSIEPATVDHLIATYGSDANKILDLIEADPNLNEKICLNYPPVLAEIRFCVENEMVMSLEDMLMRRLRLGMIDQNLCLDCAPVVAEIMADLLGWDRTRESVELSTFERMLRSHLNVFSESSAAPPTDA